jgi:hypothetical protein
LETGLGDRELGEGGVTSEGRAVVTKSDGLARRANRGAFCEFTKKHVLNVRRGRTFPNTANIFDDASPCRHATRVRILRHGNDLWNPSGPNSGAEGFAFESRRGYFPCRIRTYVDWPRT